MKDVTLLIIAAGSRGSTYARIATSLDGGVRIVGVAEPRDSRRERLAREYGVPPANVFRDWREAAERDRFADAVIIATQDAMHVAPAVAFARRGYAMLLEKPMAPDEAGCRRIVRAVQEAGILFAVCHVMRYTNYTRRIKQIIESGAIGEVVSIQHLEPVGYWHQAHSFVRGNWRKEAESSPMLLAKSCHDLDWIRYIMAVPCRSVSSFGSLYHFRRDNQPAGASDRCVTCPVEDGCPYSAKRFYLGRLRAGDLGWPLDVITDEMSEQAVLKALEQGPYGRCVYACDNDVVDNQVVNMLFEGGRTASFTMTAFNAGGGRKTRIFATRGELEGDGRYIRHFDFLTNRTETIDTHASDATAAGGHGGGDQGLIEAFIAAVRDEDPDKILSGPVETLETHLMVFAAERARRQGCVVNVDTNEQFQ